MTTVNSFLFPKYFIIIFLLDLKTDRYLQSPKDKYFTQKKDSVDKYFENSPKSISRQSEKKSENKSLQRILPSYSPLKPIENMSHKMETESGNSFFILERFSYSFLLDLKTDEYLKPSKENHFTQNKDSVDKYFNNPTKSATKESGKKSEGRSLQEILSSTFKF